MAGLRGRQPAFDRMNLTRVMPAQGGILISRARFSREGTQVQRIITSLAAAALFLTACAADGPTPGADEPTEVSFALDWAPNTNHTGVYVADALGYFDDAGLDVEILPYASTPVPELVSTGTADFGIAGQAVVQLGRTAGLDVVSVYRVTQTEVGELAVLGNRDDIRSPKDLDGMTFGGFGSPLYSAMVRTMISHDGGAGEVTEVVLDTGAYDALTSGRIDFTLSVSTWESINMELAGDPYKTFQYQDYGMPELQAVGIISSDAFLEAEPDTADAFVRSVQRGYQYAADNPAEAATILVDANPDTLGESEELVRRSIETLGRDGLWVADGVTTGWAEPEVWEDYGQFLLEHEVLVDAAGETVTDAPDWSSYYTNDHLG